MTMKRFSESGGALCAAMFAAALAALIGCSNPGGGGVETPSLVGVSVEAAKRVYILGQDLDLSAIAVTGIYSDGEKKPLDISSGNIAYDKTQAGEQTVTVTVEGKSATFTVTVVAGTDQAKEALETAVDAALALEEIVVSRDGSDVPAGVPWMSAAQKEELDEAIETALEAAASGDVGLESIVEALEALQKAAAEAAAAAETQAGTKAEWSYAVTFNNNQGTGTNPQAIRVATPKTTVENLPQAPTRNSYAFSGWNTAANGSGSKFTGTTLVVADITVYAQWTAIVNALAPSISVQPRSATYTVGDSAAALSVTAASRDGGTLSYQWQSRSDSNGEWTAISDATESSYTPPTTEPGTLSYHVEVTNAREDVDGTKTASTTSAAATVRVNPAPIVNALAPSISVQPRSATYTAGDSAAALSVTAASRDGGTLSYRWQSRSDSNGEWTAISESTESSYTPPTTEPGTLSYRVEVTNAREDVNGTKTASTSSIAATVTVNPVPIVNAQTPVLSAEPLSATYTIGDTAAALTVTAAVSDGGTLSYRWQSRASADGQWTAISGATESSYTPSAAAVGTFSYCVEITNTNDAVNGTKTASINSAEAAITVIHIGAQRPVLSVQPQNGTYAVGDAAAALTVSATVTDGGTLSYQWHSRTVNSSPAPIDGATGTSHTPSAAAPGTVYYYVVVTNTNNKVEGAKTATIRSREAKIMTGVGTGDLAFDVWVKDDRSLVSDMPNKLSISKELGQSLVINAAGDLASLQWSINGADLDAPRGTAQSIAIDAANYGAGTYTLGLRAVKGAAPYSINITFSVVN
jgi:uncharacterized repeat protein (TIGR02543 family)